MQHDSGSSSSGRRRDNKDGGNELRLHNAWNHHRQSRLLLVDDEAVATAVERITIGTGFCAGERWAMTDAGGA